jgi:hypothetical protein
MGLSRMSDRGQTPISNIRDIQSLCDKVRNQGLTPF